MLRITLFHNSDGITLKLEGRLVGLWVHEMRVVVLRAEVRQGPFMVDISDLTFADHEGEQALLWLYRMGAQFAGEASFPAYLCRRLRIPLQHKVLPRTGCGAESPAAPLPASSKDRKTKGA